MTTEIQRLVHEHAIGSELSCIDAHAIAAELGISPAELGRVVDEMTDIRFYRCQLGLFGYGPKADGQSKIVQPAKFIPDEIAQELESRSTDSRIPCLDVWQIAAQYAYPRLGMGNIVESLGLKVTPCQLGCF